MNSTAKRPHWKVQWASLITIIGAAILVGAEVFGAAFAGGWAIGGFLQLGNLLTYVLMTLFGAGGLWAMVVFLRSAIKVEPIVALDSLESPLHSTASDPP
jgi:hypothetical protein